jgi:hypothetical protein
MLEPSNYPFASEFYVVEKTIEVYVTINGESENIRIDALRCGDVYSTRAFIQRNLMVQPAFPKTTDGELPAQEEVGQWVLYDLPWTSGPNANGVLSQALGFLGERCDKTA